MKSIERKRKLIPFYGTVKKWIDLNPNVKYAGEHARDVITEGYSNNGASSHCAYVRVLLPCCFINAERPTTIIPKYAYIPTGNKRFVMLKTI